MKVRIVGKLVKKTVEGYSYTPKGADAEIEVEAVSAEKVYREYSAQRGNLSYDAFVDEQYIILPKPKEKKEAQEFVQLPEKFFDGGITNTLIDAVKELQEKVKGLTK
jgi:hypothetical protein